jgi:hypothetical protein
MPVDQYGTALAPGGLALVHSLLNTHSVAPQYEDLLQALPTAQAWLAEVLTEWAEHHGVARSDVELMAGDLPRLRELRREIRSVLEGADADVSLAAPLDLVMPSGGRVTIHPHGSRASDWIQSAVLAECLTAQLIETWPRLKLCANPACNVAFYDRSRNRSGTWHDVHICGNAINLRASRARRRSAARE